MKWTRSSFSSSNSSCSFQAVGISFPPIGEAEFASLLRTLSSPFRKRQNEFEYFTRLRLFLTFETFHFANSTLTLDTCKLKQQQQQPQHPLHFINFPFNFQFRPFYGITVCCTTKVIQLLCRQTVVVVQRCCSTKIIVVSY